MKENASAGLLLYRKTNGLEVFLAHPGGPYFKNKDNGWWTIPKGAVNEKEDRVAAARREFEEETGHKIDEDSEFISLGSIKQKGGKTVYCWAVEGDIDKKHELTSNTFKMMWPPRSDKWIEVPEIDRAQFFTIEEAKEKIMGTQLPLIERLLEYLEGEGN